MPDTPLAEIKTPLPKVRKSSKHKKYSELRDREYLLESEVTAMMKAAKSGRWGHRDSTLILMGYRHGLRISELVNLRWQQVDFKTGYDRLALACCAHL
jgi:type 1 fimbriae regulatory protein FimB/type 1 fimbriae regulatory protein FimE